MPAVVDYRKFVGINNIQDRSQIGTPYLWKASNVDCDDSGIISRRGGSSTAAVTGNFRDGFTAKDFSINLAVQDDTKLVVINQDASIKTLRSDLTPGLPMSYVDVNDKVYYTNQKIIGVVDKPTASLSNFPAITKQLSAPMPAGQFIEYYNGRLYVASGNVLVPSSPMDFGRTQYRKYAIPFPGQITLLKAVLDGLWVAAGGVTSFISGGRPMDFVLKPVCNYEAIPYTAVSVDAQLLIGAEGQGAAAMWESIKGPCIGFSGGRFLNLALNKYTPPAALSGSAVIRKNRKGTNQYICLTHT